MKERIMNNLGLKILAILCSVVLWFIVMNISDPDGSRTFYDVQVIITNESIVTDQNKVYEIKEGTDKVDVTVTAKRSILDRINATDIRVVADFSNLTLSNTIDLQLSTAIFNSSLTNIKADVTSMKLEVEDKIQRQFRILATTSGELDTDYMIGSVTTDANLVNISGAESIINQVDHVEASVNVSGMISNINTKADLKFYDKDGNLLDGSKITKNISSVLVSVEILQTKKVQLVAEAMGVTAEGYAATGIIENSPATILIAGNGDILRTIDSILIPAEAINITGKKETSQTLVNIKDYLPDGVRLANETYSGNVTVTVYVEPLIKESVLLLENQVQVLNLPETLTYEYRDIFTDDQSELELEIKGLKALVEQMKAQPVIATIDVTSLIKEGETEVMPGTYKINPTLNLVSGVELISPFEITIIISEIEEE
jgi:YbbR domain-containing protein